VNVWVIMGGMSSEREVSLDSGRAVAAALRDGGHGVRAYDLGTGAFLPGHSTGDIPLPPAPPPESTWGERLLEAARLLRGRADVAFIALHGGVGENGMVQALLESAGFPYTGSGPSACAVTMDKALTKRVMGSLGVATPPWALLEFAGESDPGPPPSWLGGTPVGGLPAVIKPCQEGSSVGISIVRESSEWEAACSLGLRAICGPRRPRQLLVEKYIPGLELTAGLLGGQALPIVEIRPRTGFYDYARKYTTGETSYEVPAAIPEAAARAIRDSAEALYRATGCGGMARADYRLGSDGIPMCMEINTIPGFTATSLLPKAAQAAGIGFLELVERVCRLALE